MTIVVCTVAIFAVWFVVSLCGQFHNFAWDILGIVPRFTFFAPNPCVVNFHVVVRFRSRDGRTTEWFPLAWSPRRNAFEFFWNPGKTKKKVTFDLILALRQESKHVRDAEVRQLLLPYATLLALISGAARDHGHDQVQFAVIEELPDANAAVARVNLISDFHLVAPTSG